MDSTKILQEFGTKYRENLRRFYEYNDLLYKTKDFEAWADNLVSRSETIRTIFKENERIAGSIRLLLKEPLTEEIAEALFSATVMLKEAELRDPGLMIEIYEALIPFYEERENTPRLIHVLNHCALEEMEFFIRMNQEDRLNRTRDKYRRVLSYKEEYPKLPLRARQGIFITYYNLIGPLPDLIPEYRKDILGYYRDAMNFFESKAVQAVDRNNETILSEIDLLNEVMITGFLRFLTAEEKLRTEYIDVLSSLWKEMEEGSRKDLILDILSLFRGRISVETMLGHLMDRILSISGKTLVFDDMEATIEACGYIEDLVMTAIEIIKTSSMPPNEKKRRASEFMSQFLILLSRIPSHQMPSYLDDTLALLFQKMLPLMDGIGEKESMLTRLILMRQPITYIHCLMVEQLVEKIGTELLVKRPAYFSRLRAMGYSSDEAIMNYLKRAARLHDIGKCQTAGVVNLQNRALTELEFSYIRLHPRKGRVFLQNDPEFAPYYDVMEGHHKWFDQTAGYPDDQDNSHSPYKNIIDLITICDSIDAATDRLGRNYADGKDFSTVLAELKAESGTRYNPEIVSCIEKSEVLQKTISALTGEGRKRIYFKAFFYLNSAEALQDRLSVPTLEEYVKNTALIRTLSAPTLQDIDNAAAYSEHLRNSFVRIGDIARENREILNACFFPYIESEKELTEVEMEAFGDFGDSLLDAYSLDNLDPAILSVLSKELLVRADRMHSDKLLILQLDREIMACYTMMNMTNRIYGCAEIADTYRKRGFAAGEKLLSYLSPELFQKLPDDDTKDLVLINARYLWVLYEGARLTEAEAAENYEKLEWILSLANDPFYRRSFPGYNWKNHVFRTLNYMALMVENHNARNLPADILDRLCRRIEEMDALYRADDYCRSLTDPEEMEMLLLRARYESGATPKEDYIRRLFLLYNRRKVENYELSGMTLNLNIPAEYLLSLNRETITEEDILRLETIYNDVINYAFHMPENGSLSYMLEYISTVFYHVIEVPGAVSFEEMCLNCLAALHPPTYVHSVMVAELSRCLCRHLWNRESALFSAMPEGRERTSLLSFAYHAGICHDVGKIMMIDTILIYGRRLLEEEFSLIRRHPEAGAYLLKNHASTRPYQNIALMHHIYYDGTGGYPALPERKDLPEKPVIDVVAVADCLDAATDTVGRSYSRGKTLEEFMDELEKGSGTRYAPYVCELFSDPAVREDIALILSRGREKNYRKTYLLLKDLKEKRKME
ncbi:MAG: HD domain-containing protein [Lachnospiraceae bacterium]|nr:HD domain-containing protein [Lachnospiraceae bacterium]